MTRIIQKSFGLLNSTHPIPCFTVTLFITLFSLASGQPLGRALLIGIAVLFQQFSVGLSNDWLDYERDLASKRKDKPSVRGIVSAIEIRNASLIAGLVALTVSYFLGTAALALMILMLAVGWAYNLGMKTNWSSVIPYAVGFGILPIFAGFAAAVPYLVPGWIILVTALFGVSGHFANALPDMFDDRATGVNALPHLLGQRLSAVVISLTAIAATVIVVTQSPSLDQVVAFLGVLLTISFVGVASLLSLRAKPPRVIFPLFLFASLVNMVLLTFGIASLR
jgi:4-hydroxybenzoate polyprenyltransferase